MSAITTSMELAGLLMTKARAAANGKDIAGADTLCRCTETFIKLARLEMEVSKTLDGNNAATQIGNIRWQPIPLDGIEVLDGVILKAALKSGETHLSEVENEIDRISEDKPKHPAVRVLSAEATYLRAYLLALRDAINGD